MAVGEQEQEQLRVVFYGFSFFLLGIVCRHFGIVYKVKASYYGLLYLAGILFGFGSYIVPHMKDPILDQCGPICLQTAYSPLFFFETGFLLQVNQIRPKIIFFTFLILLPMWVLILLAVTLICHFFYPDSIHWRAYVVMVLLSMTPDVQAIKMFFTNRYSSIDQNLVTLLEFEGLVSALLVTITFHAKFLHDGSLGSMFSLPFELVLTFLLGMLIGDVLIFWLKSIVNDIVVQTTITTAFIFIAFCGMSRLGLIPETGVFIMSVVLMRAKPSFSGKFNQFIIKFIEIFRFGLISILCVISGMELVTRVGYLIGITPIIQSLILFLAASSIRFITLIALWPIYRRYCFSELQDVLMIWACSIRGPFNLVFSLIFLLHKKYLPWADEKLFLLASIQIMFSFFITIPVASVVLTALRKRTLDYEKLAMIYRCAHVLKDMKASLVSVLRKMPFSADADWELVLSRTRIKKLFLKSYENKRIIMASLPQYPDFLEKEIRRDSIRLLLRSQRHYLEDQFEQGLVSSRTAKVLTLAIMNAYASKSMVTAANVRKKMAPRSYLLSLHADLAQDMRWKGTKVRNQALWILICVNLSLNACRLLDILFPSSGRIDLLFSLIWIYNIIFTFVVGVYFLKAVRSKLKNSWYYLLATTLVLSAAEVVSDIFMHKIGGPLSKVAVQASQMIRSEMKSFMTLYLGLTAVTICARSLCIAYCLPVFKKWMARLVHALLAQWTYMQCEAGLSFMHITKDSMHQLPDSVLEPHVMQGIQQILHQENLSTRQQLGLMEILSPEVVTSLKTFIASKVVLNSQVRTVARLRDEGFLEEFDIEQLFGIIQDKEKRLKHFPVTMKVPSVKQLLENLPILKGYRGRVWYLQRYGHMMTYRSGDVILRQGEDPMGVFFILKGLVRSECCTVPSMHSDVKPLTPVYYTHHELPDQARVEHVELSNFYSTGCVLGERMVLTDRPGHKTVRCVTEVRALFINVGVIHNLMGGRPQVDEVMSQMERNMWVCMAVRYASRLIQGKVSSDDLLTCRQVYHMLEHAYYIFGDPGTVVRLNMRHHKAVVLIHGSVWAADGAFRQEAPCFLPQRVSHQELKVGPGHRGVLLVIPAVHHGEQEEREWTFLRQRESTEGRGRDNEDDLDEMTASSDSSDGIPHRRYRDTLFMSADPVKP